MWLWLIGFRHLWEELFSRSLDLTRQLIQTLQLSLFFFFFFFFPFFTSFLWVLVWEVSCITRNTKPQEQLVGRCRSSSSARATDLSFLCWSKMKRNRRLCSVPRIPVTSLQQTHTHTRINGERERFFPPLVGALSHRFLRVFSFFFSFTLSDCADSDSICDLLSPLSLLCGPFSQKKRGEKGIRRRKREILFYFIFSRGHFFFSSISTRWRRRVPFSFLLPFTISPVFFFFFSFSSLSLTPI